MAPTETNLEIPAGPEYRGMRSQRTRLRTSDHVQGFGFELQGPMQSRTNRCLGLCLLLCPSKSPALYGSTLSGDPWPKGYPFTLNQRQNFFQFWCWASGILCRDCRTKMFHQPMVEMEEIQWIGLPLLCHALSYMLYLVLFCSSSIHLLQHEHLLTHTHRDCEKGMDVLICTIDCHLV